MYVLNFSYLRFFVPSSQNAELTAKLVDALNLNVLLEDQVTETQDKFTRELEELKADLESQTVINYKNHI